VRLTVRQSVRQGVRRNKISLIFMKAWEGVSTITYYYLTMTMAGRVGGGGWNAGPYTYIHTTVYNTHMTIHIYIIIYTMCICIFVYVHIWMQRNGMEWNAMRTLIEIFFVGLFSAWSRNPKDKTPMVTSWSSTEPLVSCIPVPWWWTFWIGWGLLRHAIIGDIYIYIHTYIHIYI